MREDHRGLLPNQKTCWLRWRLYWRWVLGDELSESEIPEQGGGLARRVVTAEALDALNGAACGGGSIGIEPGVAGHLAGAQHVKGLADHERGLPAAHPGLARRGGDALLRRGGR